MSDALKKAALDVVNNTSLGLGVHNATTIYIKHIQALDDALQSDNTDDCPNCNNDGAYYDNYGNVHQCQWCDEMPHSRYNQDKAKQSVDMLIAELDELIDIGSRGEYVIDPYKVKPIIDKYRRTK